MAGGMSRDLDRSRSGHRGEREKQWQPARGTGSQRGFNRSQGSQREEYYSPSMRTKAPQASAHDERPPRKEGQSSSDPRQRNESGGARPKEFASSDRRY